MIRVLYAEDDPQIAEMVRLHFSRHGGAHTLTVVDTGRRCLEAMERDRFDVLMVDLMMPDLDGLQVLGELTARRDPTPVIMVSGQGQHELAVRALRAGAVDCIDKNSAEFIRIPELVHRVHARSAPRPAVVTPAQIHRVLYLDSSADERDATELFFASRASRFKLTTGDLADLPFAPAPYDAILLGPNLPVRAMLDGLRQLRSYENTAPVIVLSAQRDGATAIAAFQLGAHDYLLHGPDCLTELVFSLNHALKRADTERQNHRLATELAVLNSSLAAQVAERTLDLTTELTARRAAEQRAEQLAARVLHVQEEERRSLAQELHDQIGQLLTGLRFKLEAARPTSLVIDDALGLTDELLHTVRELTLQLRPRILDDLGLASALKWHAKRFHQQTNITVELELSLPPTRLPSTLEVAAFRIVQEALTNVARHARVTTASVTATADAHALHIEISDRGPGFDAPAALARRDSLGLAGLAERVHLAGGHFELFSQPGHGTRLHAEFSLAASS